MSESGKLRSLRPDRVEPNSDIFDFQLTADEVAAIDALDAGERGGPNSEEADTHMFNSKTEH